MKFTRKTSLLFFKSQKDARTSEGVSEYSLAFSGLALVGVVYGLARYCLGLFVPEFRQAFNLSSETIGFLLGGSYFGYLAAMFPSAVLAEKYGPKLPIIMGGMSAAIGMALISSAPNTVWLGVGILLAGTSAGLAYPPFSEVILKQVKPVNRNVIYAWINSGTGFGVAVAGPIVLWSSLNWRLAWIMFAIIAIAATLWNYWTVENTSPQSDRNKRARRQSFSRWMRILSNPSAIPLFFSASFFGIATSAYWTFAVDFLHIHNNSSDDAVTFWIILGTSGAFGCVAGNLVNQIGICKSYRLLMISAAIAIVCLPFFASQKIAIYSSSALFGLTFIIATAIYGIWTLRVFGSNSALGFAATFFLISLGQGVGSIIGGLIVGSFGHVALFHIASSSCLMLALLPRVWLPKEETLQGNKML